MSKRATKKPTALEQLRQIVNLGARAKEENIRAEVIALQERTVIAALAILKREAGVILADEVGMGKTFQTLAIIACALQEDPRARILVVTPTPELNEQWFWSAQRFSEHGFHRFASGTFGVASRLRDLPAQSKKHAVVFAPLSIFVGTREGAERGFLLTLWAARRRLSAKTLRELERRIAATNVSVVPSREFLGRQRKDIPKSVLGPAFRRGEDEGQGFLGLDDLLAEGVSAFDSSLAVRRAFDRAHFHVLRSLVPAFRLLVIDEAHKLKDPWTVRAQAVTHVLKKSYDKAVFLTATPFQLGIEELRNVFQLFFNARSVPESFVEDVERLYRSVRSYQQAYARFEMQWRYVDEAQAAALSAWYERASESRTPAFDQLTDENVRLVAEQIWQLITLKQREVEPAFRQWMLRSMKPGKHARRAVDLWRIDPRGEAVVPFVLYERLIAEERKSGRTDVALADVNISSSYAAARTGRLLKDRSRHAGVRAYQDAVRRAIAGLGTMHPKIARTAQDVVAAAAAGEKTLVFCERTATIKALQSAIEAAWMERQLAAWNQVCPGFSFEEIFGSGRTARNAVRGVSEKIPPRFFRGSDELSIAFAESLTFALFADRGQAELPREFWQATGEVLERANRILAGTRLPSSLASRLDYPVALRCVDQAAAQWFKKHAPGRLTGPREVYEAVLDPRYPAHGFLWDLARSEEDPSARASWSISRAIFESLFGPRRPGIWVDYRAELAQFPPVVRGLIVEAVRYFLTRREVSFLAELMQRVGSPQEASSRLREQIEQWWNYGCAWRSRVSELIAYLPCLTRAEQQEVLSDMLRSPRIVQNSLASSSRIARQNAFNAPFYPMVLVGNQAFQQGLDLHRQCRRIIHFDLRWNPTDLEQRIGRIERHGSLAERFDAGDPRGKVQVIYALLERTADAQLYRSVKLREKWMDFLLGQPPRVSEHEGQATPSLPLPQRLVEHMRIELGPE